MVPSTSSARSALRSRSARLLALLALVAVAAVAAIPMRAAAQEPIATFQESDCGFELPEGITADCGFLIAPESHNNFDGDLVALATVILRSPNPNPAPDPVVVLQGGPGASALVLTPGIAELWAPVLATRDVIIFDQRGAGLSQPGLFCPPLEVDSLLGKYPVGAFQAEQRPAIIDLQVELLTLCGRAYQEAGIDLTKYNTLENAADIEDLRRVLGLGQINLYGASYGTRLALEAMRFRPGTLRSVIIDSVVPAQGSPNVDLPRTLNLSFEALFASCAADAACNAAYPGLGPAWDALYARINATPLQVPIYNLESGELATYLPVNGWDLTQIMALLLSDTSAVPLVPALIGETAAGRIELLSIIFSLLFQPGEGEPPPPQFGLAATMYYATQCYDDNPFITADDFIRVRSQNLRGQPRSISVSANEAFKEVCANLGLGQDTPAFVDQPVVSDVPTFVIAGEFDPLTAPDRASAAASTLSRSTPVVVYPRGGHVPSFASLCLTNAVAQFYNDPTTTPDTSCIAAETQPYLLPLEAQARLQQMTADRSWIQRLR